MTNWSGGAQGAAGGAAAGVLQLDRAPAQGRGQGQGAAVVGAEFLEAHGVDLQLGWVS